MCIGLLCPWIKAPQGMFWTDDIDGSVWIMVGFSIQLPKTMFHLSKYEEDAENVGDNTGMRRTSAKLQGRRRILQGATVFLLNSS
jgi:hypothetical protein